MAATNARTAATPAINEPRPLDARLARTLIESFRPTRLRPPHIKAARAVLGLVACFLLALGGYIAANIGAFLFIISNFIDHADDELAHATNDATRFGHAFKLAADWLIHALLFVGLGLGLASYDDSTWPLWLGIFCGALVAFTAVIHEVMRVHFRKSRARLPTLTWFEIDDILYLLPLITLFGVQAPFLLLAAVGLPLFSAWIVGTFAQCWLARNDEA